MFVKIVCALFVVATGMRSDQHKGEELMKTESISHESQKVHTAEQSHTDQGDSKLGENISLVSKKVEKAEKAEKAEKVEAKLMDPDFNFDFFKGKAEELSAKAINDFKRELGEKAKGQTCPKEFDMIPDGYDYGVGCGLKDIGCKCPSFLDVCATSPRMGKAEDLQNLITRLSVSQLGYCRTGAWVFILSAVLVLGLLGGIGFFIYKKR
mmetsp:Transcript_7420/g.12120  ORF Transcript_7420/g.12120 Transcript_7420/m.12120 type:complete len:209 (+) Transcript_7420:66-692(+)